MAMNTTDMAKRKKVKLRTTTHPQNPTRTVTVYRLKILKTLETQKRPDGIEDAITTLVEG